MKIEKICMLAKLDDGTIRQILIEDSAKDIILGLVAAMETDKAIKILETELQGIEF